MKKNVNNNVTRLIIVIILGFILVVANNFLGEARKEVINVDGLENITIETGCNCITKIENDGNLRVYFFDVGQADSMLIVDNAKTMLIDAGNNDDGDLVVNNLKKLGITKIDYLVGTHPHEDHIGGLDDVIKNFDIGTIYLPKVQANTKTFEDVLDAIADKNLSITTPKIGDEFTVGNANCEVMYIGANADDLNSCSIVIRMEKDDISYLFTGDAEESAESTRNWPQTTILKVGHHGSSTSSSVKFLSQVKPIISVISAGKDNKYGHPHDEVLEGLEEINSKVYMTKDVGDILITQK